MRVYSHLFSHLNLTETPQGGLILQMKKQATELVAGNAWQEPRSLMLHALPFLGHYLAASLEELAPIGTFLSNVKQGLSVLAGIFAKYRKR